MDCQRCPNTALCELIVCLHVNVELVQLRQLFLSQKPDEMLFPKEVGFANVHLLGYLHDALLLSSLFGTVDEPGARQVAPGAYPESCVRSLLSAFWVCRPLATT